MRRPVGVTGIRIGLCRSLLFSRRVATDAILPSALFEERFCFARCKLGVLVYSRCCHLIVDLFSVSPWKLGQAIDAVTGTRL